MTLQCLEWEKDATGQRKWYRNDRWVDVAEDLTLVYLAVRVLTNLWAVAKVRQQGGGLVSLRPLDGLTPSAIRENRSPRSGSLRVPILAVPLSGDDARKVLDRLRNGAGQAGHSPNQGDSAGQEA